MESETNFHCYLLFRNIVTKKLEFEFTLPCIIYLFPSLQHTLELAKRNQSTRWRLYRRNCNWSLSSKVCILYFLSPFSIPISRSLLVVVFITLCLRLLTAFIYKEDAGIILCILFSYLFTPQPASGSFFFSATVHTYTSYSPLATVLQLGKCEPILVSQFSILGVLKGEIQVILETLSLKPDQIGGILFERIFKEAFPC